MGMTSAELLKLAEKAAPSVAPQLRIAAQKASAPITAREYKQTHPPAVVARKIVVPDAPVLPVINRKLEIFLPDFKFATWNSFPKNPYAQVAWKKAERERAEKALRVAVSCGVRIWRIEDRVDFHFVQMVLNFKNAKDSGNLVHKWLMDCLTTRGNGLGVIQDDSPVYVRTVSQTVTKCTGNWTPGVVVVVSPVIPHPLAPKVQQ